MNFHPFRFLALIFLLLAAPSGVIPNAQADSNAGAANELDTLVSAEWLHQHLDDPDLVVLDCTVMVGADEVTDARRSAKSPKKYSLEYARTICRSIIRW